MKLSEIQTILQSVFVFSKELPGHLYQNKNYGGTFLVSPLSDKTQKRLEVVVPFDTYVHSFKSGEYLLEDKNNNSSILLRDAGPNQSFAYFFYYAFLGGFLGAAMKTMDKGLSLKEDGLYLSRDYPLKANHHQTIHTELVTDDFEEILHLFKLSPSTILAGFETKEQYFQYLCTSPYLNPVTLARIEDSRCEFMADFYYAMKKYSWSIYDARPLPKIESSNKYFPRFSYEYFVNTYNQRLDYFMNVTAKSDPLVLLSLLKKDFPEADSKFFGKLMVEFKHEFKSKGAYKDFLFTSNHDDIAKKLKDIAIQKCIQ